MSCFIIKKRNIVAIIVFVSLLFISLLIFAGRNTAVSSPSRQLPIYAVETTEKKVAITFDAAWSNQDTQKIIEILAKHNAVATFFIVGDWASKFPESVKAFYDAGHTIANHSDTHKAFSKCSRQEIQTEIKNCNEKLESITNSTVTLVRAPSGDYTNDSIDVAREMGMFTIQWDVDSLDYTKISVDEIVGRVVPSVKCGSIILFHNGVENTAEALDRVLTELEKQGYSFVSVDELIFKDNYTIDHTGRQHKTR